jgi:hypothetical protein
MVTCSTIHAIAINHSIDQGPLASAGKDEVNSAISISEGAFPVASVDICKLYGRGSNLTSEILVSVRIVAFAELIRVTHEKSRRRTILSSLRINCICDNLSLLHAVAVLPM